MFGKERRTTRAFSNLQLLYALYQYHMEPTSQLEQVEPFDT